MKMKQFLIRKPSERKKFAAMMTQRLLERDGVCIALTLDEITGNFVVAFSPEPTETQQAQLRPHFLSGQNKSLVVGQNALAIEAPLSIQQKNKMRKEALAQPCVV